MTIAKCTTFAPPSCRAVRAYRSKCATSLLWARQRGPSPPRTVPPGVILNLEKHRISITNRSLYFQDGQTCVTVRICVRNRCQTYLTASPRGRRKGEKLGSGSGRAGQLPRTKATALVSATCLILRDLRENKYSSYWLSWRHLAFAASLPRSSCRQHRGVAL